MGGEWNGGKRKEEDISIHICTGVSTSPSTSRPLLAAYAVQAVRLTRLAACLCACTDYSTHAYIAYSCHTQKKLGQILTLTSNPILMLTLASK